MSDSTDDLQRRQTLSALMDGAAEPHAVARACALWREHADARAEWHAYQLIGDVLRSDDLAQAPGHDRAFLVALRGRLAQEPVLLAPQRPAAAQAPVAARRRRGWMAPVAVTAGFVAVAGVLVVTRVDAPPGTMLAAGPPTAPVGVQPVRAAVPATVPQATLVAREVPADGKLIRDVRLDRYLAAHKQYGSAYAAPAVVLRSATTVAPER